MDTKTENLARNHISHRVLQSVINKNDSALLKSSEIIEHLNQCQKCSELIEIIKDVKAFAGRTKPDADLNHPPRIDLAETITRAYEQSLSPKEAANFLSHLETCSQCFNYVGLVLEDSFSPLPENIETELEVYSNISIAEKALELIPSQPSKTTIKLNIIWEKMKSIFSGVFEIIKQKPAPRLAFVVILIIGIAIGQGQFREWRAMVHTKAGMEHLQNTWKITDDDLRPPGNFPRSIFSITHSPESTEGTAPSVSEFETALRWDENNKEAKRGLAIYWCFTGNLAGADSLLRTILVLDKLDFEAWNLLGLVAARQENSTRALNAFEKALQIRPDYAEAAYNRAMVLQQLGHLEKAKKAWQEYLKIESQSEWSEVAKKRLSSFNSP
ncbi:MAG: tetratricopeptide repeat protein [bacterium]